MRRLLASILLASAVSTADAQRQSSLMPGDRIRVTFLNPGTPMQTGNLQALTDTTVHIQTESLTVAIRRAVISRVELSGGKKPSLPGGVAGFVLGAAAGGVVGCMANKDDYGVFCAGQDDTKVIVGAALGAAVGATLGAVLFRQERWTAVDVSLSK